jgi:hypothetical protein
MSAPNDAVPAGSTGTLTIADSLRQVADWFDQHPEITVQHSFVKVNASERQDLETLAAALGDRAIERVLSYGSSDVEIRGDFDGTEVYAHVPLAKLAGAPVEPTYQPILPPEEWQDDLDRQTGEGRR